MFSLASFGSNISGKFCNLEGCLFIKENGDYRFFNNEKEVIDLGNVAELKRKFDIDVMRMGNKLIVLEGDLILHEFELVSL